MLQQLVQLKPPPERIVPWLFGGPHGAISSSAQAQRQGVTKPSGAKDSLVCPRGGRRLTGDGHAAPSNCGELANHHTSICAGSLTFAEVAEVLARVEHRASPLSRRLTCCGLPEAPCPNENE